MPAARAGGGAAGGRGSHASTHQLNLSQCFTKTTQLIPPIALTSRREVYAT